MWTCVRQPYDSNTVKTFASSTKAGFGKVPDLARGKVPEDWWYFPVVARLHSERTGFPTQKPEALLQAHRAGFVESGGPGRRFLCRLWDAGGRLPVVVAGISS